MGILNLTGVDLFDVPIKFFKTEFLGTTELALIGLLGLAIAALIMTDARKELVLLVPLPLIVLIADSATQNLFWMKAVAYLILGIWLGSIVVNMLRVDK